MTIKIVQAETTGGVCVANGTKIFNEDGTEIKDVFKCVVVMEPNGIVIAELSLSINFSTIEAEPILSLGSLEKAAEYYGLRLVKK